MALLILEILVLASVKPKGIRLVRFEFHLENVGLLIGFVFWFAEWCSVCAFPRLDPTPGTISHFFAERHFDLDGPRRDIRSACFGHSLHDDRRHRIDALLRAALQGYKGTEANNGQESDQSDFVHLVWVEGLDCDYGE